MIAQLLLVVIQAQVLTLREAERRAEAHQPALAVTQYAAAAASARALENRGALLPQVAVVANYRYATANRTIRIGTPAFAVAARQAQASFQASSRLFDYFNAGVTATQLLYDFGQTTDAWRAARLSAESATFDAQATRIDVLLQVRLAFFSALAHRELLEVTREDFENQERHLEQVRALIDVKLRPTIDLLQARANVGSAELRRIAAENDYALSKADLHRAMGEGAADDFDIAAEEMPPVEGEDSAPGGLAAQATAARPDLASSGRQIAAQERAVAAARGSYGPAVHLELGASDVGPMFDQGPFDTRNLRWNYSAALVLTWPLYEGGRTQARVREAEALLGEARGRHAMVDVGLRVEVERAQRSVASAKAAVVVAETTSESARERLRMAEGRYKEGVGTALEVSDAQLVNVTTAAQRVQARYDLATARAQLMHALGRDR